MIPSENGIAIIPRYGPTLLYTHTHTGGSGSLALATVYHHHQQYPGFVTNSNETRSCRSNRSQQDRLHVISAGRHLHGVSNKRPRYFIFLVVSVLQHWRTRACSPCEFIWGWRWL